MKNFKKLIFKCSGVLCMVAMFLAVHSANVMCGGKFYQAKVPKELDKFRKN